MSLVVPIGFFEEAESAGASTLIDAMFWHDFNTTGNQTDQTGNGNTATAYGTPVISSGGGPGGRDALIFDGTDDYFRVPNSATYEFGGGVDWTWSCWIYMTGTSGAICAKRGSADEFWVRLNGGYFGMHIRQQNTPVDPTILTSSQWYHFVVTYEAATKTCSIYRDGNLTPVVSAVYGSHPPDDNDLFVIGRSYTSISDWFSGRLFGHVGWPRVLSGPEITELNNSGAGLLFADL
jgi:hypothetical protein